MKFYFKILIFSLLLCSAELGWAEVTRLTKFRFSVEPTKIRLVFDAVGKVNYTTAVFSDRTVVSIKKAKLIPDLKKVNFSRTPINSIVSAKKNNELQLTIKLQEALRFKHFLLAKPGRLVLDFYFIAKEKAVVRSGVELSSAPKQHDIDSGPKKAHQQVAAVERSLDNLESDLIAKMYQINQTPQSDLLDDGAGSNSTNGNYNGSDDAIAGQRNVVVVIDPGHGGHDPGAIGPNGTKEKNVTLAVAKALQETINKTAGFRAVLTRNKDYFISLRKRLNIAHDYAADMFISIHADAYKYRDVEGVSIFALSQRGATSEAARWLAEKENESELGQAISDKNALLRSVLIDLAQTATIGSSLEIGKMLLHSLSNIASLHSKNVEQAAFVVLKSPDIPSLLVEVGFISYSKEEMKLRRSDYQQEIAAKIAFGIKSYFIRRPPRGTYLAKMRRDNNFEFSALKDSLPGSGG